MKAKLHKDMSMEKYHSYSDIKKLGDKAVLSKSMLSKFMDCPMRFKHLFIDGNVEPKTKSLRLGSAVHTLALEPELWKSGYHILPDTYEDAKGMVKPFKRDLRMQCYQDQLIAAGYIVGLNEETQKMFFEETDKSKVVLSTSEYEKVEQMAEALTKNKFAYSILKSEGYVESSIFFDYEGIKMRTRPDYLRNDNVAADVKITKSAKPALFNSDAYSYGYDISVAITAAAHEALYDRPLENYVFVCVEQEAPFIVECYETYGSASSDFPGLSYKDIGDLRLKKVIDQYKKCKEKDEWPSYNKKIATMGAPYWAIKQMFEG